MSWKISLKKSIIPKVLAPYMAEVLLIKKEISISMTVLLSLYICPVAHLHWKPKHQLSFQYTEYKMNCLQGKPCKPAEL